ncbi:hypothetical protein BC828DRAFT_384972 [Blastocladiella britannica]|nr:hypothetical protein BC828DRAFT_384972 [Blastocladiella britannica]
MQQNPEKRRPLLAVVLLALGLVFTLAPSAAMAQSDPAILPAPTTTVQDAGPAANGYKVWHAGPVPRSWPVIFAAVPPGLDITNANTPDVDTDNASYTWLFATTPGGPVSSQACTVAGIPYQSPCTGKVAEYTFNGAGTFAAQCIISRGGQQIAVLTTSVVVAPGINRNPTQHPMRREFRDLRIEDWNRYISAARALKALKVWDHLALDHAMTFLNSSASPPGGNTRTIGHSSPAFLTWHRAFLRIVERLLQKVLMDNTFGLPYWDWTIDAAGGMFSSYPADHPNLPWLKSFVPNAASPVPVFTDRYMGPTGPNGIPSGPVCSKQAPGGANTCKTSWAFPAQFGLSSTIITREVAAAAVKLPTPQQLQQLMQAGSYDTAPWASAWPAPWAANAPQSFRGGLEGWSASTGSGFHNDVHRWIGGTMLNVRYSCLDPVFFLHHTNVDRLFQLWQQQHNCFGNECFRPRAADLTADMPGVIATRTGLRLRGHMIDDTMAPWGVLHSDVWSTSGVVGEYEFVQPFNAAPLSAGAQAQIAAAGGAAKDASLPGTATGNAGTSGTGNDAGSPTKSGTTTAALSASAMLVAVLAISMIGLF